MAKAKTETETKANMMRAALKVMPDGKPSEINAFLKKEYGVELPANIISNYKSVLKKKAGQPTGKRGRPAVSGSPPATDPLTEKMKLPEVLAEAGTNLNVFKTALDVVQKVADKMGGLENATAAVVFWEQIEAGITKLKAEKASKPANK